MVGSGFYLSPAAVAPYGWLSVVSWAAMGAGAICLGLTFARYEVLMLLLFSRRGSLPLGKVGARLQVHPASVTNVVDRLEADGLVRRVPHPSDGRTTLAEITPAGRSLAERATTALNAAVFEPVALTGPQVDQLVGLLRRLRVAEGDFDPGTAG